MVDSAYFVKSTLLRAFIASFQHFVDMLQTYENMHKDVWCWKNIFWQTDRVFNTANLDNCSEKSSGLRLHNVWNYLLLELPLDLSNTLQIFTPVNLFAFQIVGSGEGDQVSRTSLLPSFICSG